MSLMSLLGDAGKSVSGFVAGKMPSGGGGGIGDLVKLIGEIRGRQKTNTAINQTNVPTGAESQANALYQALLDPNNPMLEQLSAPERERNMADFQSQIRAMQLADRRAGAMGRSPTFFNPERADEAVSYLTSRGMPQVNALSRQQAQQRVMQAASGISGQIPLQAGRQERSMQQGVSNAGYNSQVPSKIWDILQSLQQNPQVMTTAPSKSPILWNDQADKNGIMWNQKVY
jgi:hypothetical protein